MQKQYHAEMQRMYDLVAEDYLGDAADAYYSLDDAMTLHEVDVRYALTGIYIAYLIADAPSNISYRPTFPNRVAATVFTPFRI